MTPDDRKARTAAAVASFLAEKMPRFQPMATARRRSPTPEGALLRKILDALNRRPDVVALRNTVGMHRDPHRTITYGLGTGSSDLLCLLAPTGRAAFLEVKAPAGRLTEPQQRFLDRMHRIGVFATVVRSVDEACAAIERAQSGAVA